MIRKRLVVALGFLGFTGAVALAHITPATGYELSIYDSTPSMYWGGITVALVVGAVCLIYWEKSDGLLGVLGGLLLGLTVLSVAGLPAIRGYYFYGQFDPLTQLGLAYEIYHSKTYLFVYPFYHSLSVELSQVSGLSIRHGLLLTLVLGMGLYAAAVPFIASRLSAGGRRVRRIGLIVALIGVPIMTVRLPQFAPIPNMMAALIWPLACGCYLAWHQTRESGWGLLTIGFASVVVFVHPTAAVGLSLLLITYAGMMFVLNREQVRFWDSAFPLPLAITTVSFIWISSFEGKVTDFTTSWTLEAGVPGGDVNKAGDSLAQIGVSLFELFMKIVFVKVLLVALAGLLCSWLLVKYVLRPRSNTMRERMIVSLGAGLIPIGVLILGFFAIGISNQYSRYVGIILAPTAALAAVAVQHGHKRLIRRVPSSLRIPWYALGVVVAVCMISSSIMIVHASPWVVRPTKHVTEQQMVGYETAIENGDEGIQFVGVYTQPRRTLNAYYGSKPDSEVGSNLTWRRSGGRASDYTTGGLNNLRFESPKYLIVTKYGRDTHTRLFEGVVFDSPDFQDLPKSTNASRVYANGEFEMYHLDGNSTVQTTVE